MNSPQTHSAKHYPQEASAGQYAVVPAGGGGGADVPPYTGLSDDGLIEMLNGSIHMQMFCGVLIDPDRPIKNGKIVSAIRNRIASVLDIRELQKVLYDGWEGSLRNKDLCLTDVSCYESHLRFPTDVKLLWECCVWLQSLIAKTCKVLKERQPRNKYHDIDRARLAYAKQRKHTKAATDKLRRRLLGLLSKQIVQWNRVCKVDTVDITLTAEQSKCLSALKEVYRQQSALARKEEVKRRTKNNRHSALDRHGGQLRQSKTTLRGRPYSGPQRPQRDTAALFRHPHGKRLDTCRATTCHRKKGATTTKTPGVKKTAASSLPKHIGGKQECPS